MKPTLKNRAKIFWHCLIRFHRRSPYTFTTRIFCDTCGYGLGKHNPDKEEKQDG